jgi:hypothetical protein
MKLKCAPRITERQYREALRKSAVFDKEHKAYWAQSREERRSASARLAPMMPMCGKTYCWETTHVYEFVNKDSGAQPLWLSYHKTTTPGRPNEIRFQRETLMRVISGGQTFKSNWGDKRSYVDAIGVDGHCYTGTHFHSTGAVRLRRMEDTKKCVELTRFAQKHGWLCSPPDAASTPQKQILGRGGR